MDAQLCPLVPEWFDLGYFPLRDIKAFSQNAFAIGGIERLPTIQFNVAVGEDFQIGRLEVGPGSRIAKRPLNIVDMGMPHDHDVAVVGKPEFLEKISILEYGAFILVRRGCLAVGQFVPPDGEILQHASARLDCGVGDNPVNMSSKYKQAYAWQKDCPQKGEEEGNACVQPIDGDGIAQEQ